MTNSRDEKWCTVSSCCGCIELRLGSLLIGYCGSLTIFILMIFVVAGLILISTSFFIYDLLEHFKQYLVIIASGILMYLIINFIMFVLLVLGSIKKRPKYLRIFFGIGCFVLSVNAIIMVQCFAMEAWIPCGFQFVSIVAQSYLLIVVRSTYLFMEGAIVPKFKAPKTPPPETDWP